MRRRDGARHPPASTATARATARASGQVRDPEQQRARHGPRAERPHRARGRGDRLGAVRLEGPDELAQQEGIAASGLGARGGEGRLRLLPEGAGEHRRDGLAG